MKKEIVKKYKEIAIKSLTDNMNLWEYRSQGCMDILWEWYQSPSIYNNDRKIIFSIDNRKFLNVFLMVDVYDVISNNREQFKIYLNPFSKLYKMLRNVRKNIIDKEIKERESLIFNAIK